MTDALFMTKVDKTASCWLWRGHVDRWGYGQVKRNGRVRGAHRVAYELLVAPIPEGLTLDHLCRVRHCVNPAHLEPVTRGENVLRGESVIATNSRKTHCKRGHELTPENTYRVPGAPLTHRECRACASMRRRLRYERTRA